MIAELRILDAAGNRAREALRVMEDVARFGLDDAGLSTALKAARHDLHAAFGLLADRGVDARALLESRDTPGDVGTALTTTAEGERADLTAMAAAASARLTEALRSIEEVCKVLDRPTDAGHGTVGEAWTAVEALRYRAYDIQRRLMLALNPPARQWRLCVLITEALCTHWPWDLVAQRAIEAGADCVQLREKGMESAELLRRARRLVEFARPRGTAVIVNDRPDIALLAGADGVHVGQSDVTVAEVRRLSARPYRRLLVGVSCSTLAQAREAVESGADYVGLGPVFESSTKPKAGLAGIGLIEAVVGDPVASRVPHLAISGITAENVGELVAAGCRGVALSGAVCGAEDPGATARALLGGGIRTTDSN